MKPLDKNKPLNITQYMNSMEVRSAGVQTILDYTQTEISIFDSKAKKFYRLDGEMAEKLIPLLTVKPKDL